jgi:serpin B
MMRNLVFSFLLLATSCAHDTSAPEPWRPLTIQEQNVARANTAFGLNLLQAVHRSESTGNLLLSPLSVSMALGMTLNGAAGETYDAMRRTLSFDAASQAEINGAYSSLLRQLRARDPNVEIGIANSIWYNTGFNVRPAFIDTVKQYFAAEIRQLSFADPSAPRVISDWAAAATNDRIQDLIQSIAADEMLFLVNAVYFKAPWTRIFEEHATRAAPFTREDGSTVSAQMMSVDAAYRWLKNDDVQAVELMYGDSAFSMVLLSPAAGHSLDAVTTRLEPARWQALIDSLQSSRVMLSMPKFKFTYEKALRDALTALGMGVAFDPARADLSRIADVSPERLYISRVQHKTFIDVHEKGTEAAGATFVGVSVTSMPPELRFDRPFLFAIRERESGTLLFVGRVVDPT